MFYCRGVITTGLLVCLLGQAAEGQEGDANPRGTLTIGATNPVQKDTVRVEGTWTNCGSANKAELTLYKGTVKQKQNAVSVGVLSASPAGPSGKLAGDMTDPTKYKSGDTVFAVLKVYDGTNVIVDKITDDFKVP